MTSSRLLRFLTVNCVFYGAGLSLAVSNLAGPLRAFGLGLVGPGGGFLLSAGWGSGMQGLALALFCLSVCAFCIAMLLWFATGNILAPSLTWLGLSFLAALQQFEHDFAGAGHHTDHAGSLAGWFLVAVPAAISLAFLARIVIVFRQKYLCDKAVTKPCAFKLAEDGSLPVQVPATSYGEEMSPADIRRLRLLLDRALQPIPHFEGFEWLDQFQTAAVRYQINSCPTLCPWQGIDTCQLQKPIC